MTLNLLMIIILAVLIVLFLLFVGECFKTWSDFFKCFGFHPDLRYRCLFFILRRGKNLRFVQNFPSDLRKACLDKDSIFFMDEKDSEKLRDAKEFAQRVLEDDSILNDYFKGHYLTYKNYQEIVAILEQKYPSPVTKQDLIDDFAIYFNDKVRAEQILDLLIEELKINTTGDDGNEIYIGAKCAILYRVLASLSSSVFPQKHFVDILDKMKAFDNDIQIRGKSTLSKYNTKCFEKGSSELLYFQNMKEKFGVQ